MVFKRYFTSISILFLMVSCNTGEDDTLSNQLFCEVAQVDTYTLGTDPSVDFDVNNVSRTSDFTTVTCPGVSAATSTTTVDRVIREESQLSFIDSGNVNGVPFQLLVNEGKISTQIFYNYVGSCTIQTQFSGDVNATNNTLVITQSNQYNGDCSSLF